MHEFVYLASQSPRRAELLRQIGVRFELLLADKDEDAEALELAQKGEAPATYVARVTALKLDAAVQRLKRRRLAPAPIVCSDTTVALGRQIYGKPESDSDAARMLAELSGRQHRVITGVAIQSGRKRHEVLSTSTVRFCSLSAAQIQAYVDTGEPTGKAGAYAIQGAAAAFVDRIAGSHSGIMGLPLFETAQILSKLAVMRSS